MNSSVRLVETNFLSSRNSIVSFRALLKFLKFGRINLRKTLFLLVETDFLATRSQFFPFFRYSFLLVKGIFFSRGNIFLNEFLIPYGGDGFSVLQKLFSLICSFFFYKWKTSLKLVEINLIVKTVPVERDFPPSGNCFL